VEPLPLAALESIIYRKPPPQKDGTLTSDDSLTFYDLLQRVQKQGDRHLEKENMTGFDQRRTAKVAINRAAHLRCSSRLVKGKW